MNILITGITGFIGSHLAKKLLEQHDIKVFGITRYNSEGTHRLKKLGIENHERLELIQADLTDPKSIERAFAKAKPDYVYHLGAMSHVGYSFKVPYTTYQVNVLGTLAIVENCVKQKCKIIFAGTSEEYGVQFFTYNQWIKFGEPKPEPTKLPEFPIKETNPLRPVSPYAISKANAEELIKTYERIKDLDYTIMRVFNTEGAGRGDNFVLAEITRQMLLVERGQKDIVELGNVMTLRDIVHVNDTVEAYINAISYQRDTFNVATNNSHSILKLAMLVYKLLFFAEDVKALVFKYKIDKKKLVKIFTLENVDSFMVKYYIDKTNLIKPDYKIVLTGGEKDVIINISKERFRPADVYLLLGDNSKLLSKGWKPKYNIINIINDMIEYYRGIYYGI